jgi:hypothetical protein
MSIEADFARYATQDALCCPHATTTVLYRVTTAASPRFAPVELTTRTNAP